MKLKIATLLVIGLSALASLSAQTQGSRPNIIIILADDLGYGDVGFNRADNFPADRGIIPTPHLDALASHAIVGTNVHVAHPFCGPSRAAILTGMYPHRIGAQYNLPNDITTELGVPVEETYFSTLMQEANYSTAAYGKWHLGFVEGKYQPLDRGFDEFLGFCGGGKNYFSSEYDKTWYKYTTNSAEYNDSALYNTPKDKHTTNEYLDPLQRDRDYVDRKENNLDDYLTDVLTDEALDFIERKATASEPFMQYLAYNAPHTPLQAPAEEIAQFLIDNPTFESTIREGDYIKTSDPVSKPSNVEKYAKAKVEDEGAKGDWALLSSEEQAPLLVEAEAALLEKMVNARIVYATMVSNLDSNIGRIVTKLNEKGIMENTLILFLSDNGGYTFSKGAVNYPLDALKGSIDEGGHRVPFFAHWPDKITSPSVYPYQLSSMDLYPTLVNLAGGTIPATKTVDGIDFMDKIIAGEEVRPGKVLHVLRPQNGFHNAAIISYPYRITKKGGNGAWRLYDVNTNPQVELTGTVGNSTATAIIAELQGQGIDWAKGLMDIKPAWFDHERGDGHPHRILWFGEDNAGNTATPVFPGLDKTYGFDATNINEVLNRLITVYPNPSSETFTITFDATIKDLNIELVSSNGQTLKSIQTSQVKTSSIDVSNIASGMYILKIKADNNLSFEKVFRL